MDQHINKPAIGVVGFLLVAAFLAAFDSATTVPGVVSREANLPGRERARALRNGTVTLKVRVLSYDGDIMHSSAVTPDGMYYHPDWYDRLICEVISPGAFKGKQLQIWGWNRQSLLSPPLDRPGTVATVKCNWRKRDTPPWEAGPAGFGQWEIQIAILKAAEPREPSQTESPP